MKRIVGLSALAVVLAAAPLAAQTNPYPNNSGTTNTNGTTTNDNAKASPNSEPNTLSSPNGNTTNTNTNGNDMNNMDHTNTTNADNHNLPSTASPLPLVALSGLLSLAGGTWLSRRRRS